MHSPAVTPPVAAAAPIGRWLAIAVVIVLLDQATKAWIEHAFAFGERLPIIPGWFDLTLVYNKGAAFSFLSDAAGWQRWFFIGIGVAATVFIVWLLRRHAGERMFSLALALIMGGAIGNVVDRVFRGQVVDFFLAYYDRYHFPAFNVADSAITVGAALLILDELGRLRQRH